MNRLPILEHLITYPRTFHRLRLPILEHHTLYATATRSRQTVYLCANPPIKPKTVKLKPMFQDR